MPAGQGGCRDLCLCERAGALPSTARHGNTKIHKRDHTARWKITAWAWQINCGIKVLMGNKKEKTSYSSPWHRIKLTRFSNALLELLCSGALVAAAQIMLPYLNWLEQGCILSFQRWRVSLHLHHAEVEESCSYVFNNWTEVGVFFPPFFVSFSFFFLKIIKHGAMVIFSNKCDLCFCCCCISLNLGESNWGHLDET